MNEEAPPSNELIVENDLSETPSRVEVAFSDYDISHDLAQPLPRRKRRRRRRTNWPLLIVWTSLFVAWLIYAIAVPQIAILALQNTAPKRFLPPELAMSFPTRTLLKSCEFFFIFWFFYFGACIGSFLNVVASRTPRGVSIVVGGSHCPFCNTDLGFFENMPVFGWLGLRGCCKTCRLPIAPRYLIIEVCTGLVFMGLAIAELIANGYNMPQLEPQWDLIGAYLLHSGMVAILIMMIATHMDQLRFPWQPILALAVVAIGVEVFVPRAAAINWSEPFLDHGLAQSQHAIERLISGVVGLVFGALLGVVTSRLVASTFKDSLSREDASNESVPNEEQHAASDFKPLPSLFDYHWTLMMALAGATLGWQAILMVAVTGTIVACIATPALATNRSVWPNQLGVHRLQVIAMACLVATLTLHQMIWRPLAKLLGLV